MVRLLIIFENNNLQKTKTFKPPSPRETKNIFNLNSEKLDDHPLGEAGADDLTAPVPGQSLIVVVMVVG